MRSQVPPICAHCQSNKSPLWRRGANMEVLCNACGLYWKHHNTYRPLALKAAADRKSSVSKSIPGEQQRTQSAGSTSTHPLAYTNPQVTQFYFNYNNESQNDQVNVRKAGPMRTSNILMAPDQHNHQSGHPGIYSRSTDINRQNENILPPLDYKNSVNAAKLNAPNLLANQRQLSAAPVLPNLKSVIESLSSENISAIQKRSNNMNINGNSPKSSNNHQNGHSSISGNNTMNHQYPTLRNNFYPQQNNNLNAPIKFIIHRGITIYQGDHVSIRGSDSQVYFAILMDFWLTENGKRYCTLRWLLPRPKASFTSALQDRFDLGPIHHRVEAMETILDVFYSPYRDQMTAEIIRRKFLLSSTNDSNSETGSGSVSVDPPVQLIKAIKSLSGDLETVTKIDGTSIENSPSSKLFKSSEDAGVPMNPIVAECSEIAAKMLLSMN